MNAKDAVLKIYPNAAIATKMNCYSDGGLRFTGYAVYQIPNIHPSTRWTFSEDLAWEEALAHCHKRFLERMSI